MLRLPALLTPFLILTALTVGVLFTAVPVLAQEDVTTQELQLRPLPSAPEPELTSIQSNSAEAVGLMAIPPRIGEDGSLVVQPGGTVQLEVRVRNTSDRSVTTRTLAEDFIIGDDGITPVPVAELTSSRWSAAQWIQIPQPIRQIAPGESATIPFVIQVPNDALPGGHYTMIMHQIEGATGASNAQSTGGQTGINQRVGTLVYLRVAGPITQDANIRNLIVPNLIEYGPVPIRFEVENLSDIHIRPSSNVVIKDWFGREIDRLSTEPKNVFPLSNRSFEVSWEHVWGFGRYTVEVETSYGDEGRSAQAMVHFWMIPYTMIGGAILMVLAVVAILTSIRRHIHHRNDVTHKHIELLEEKIKHLESEIPDQS